MRFGITAAASILLLGLVGCTAATEPTLRTPTSSPSDSPLAAVKACGGATQINTIIANADFGYSSDKSIDAYEWTREIVDAKEQARDLANSNDDDRFAPGLGQWATWLEGLDETAPEVITDRQYNETTARFYPRPARKLLSDTVRAAEARSEASSVTMGRF
jgi:hypothetical protein